MSRIIFHIDMNSYFASCEQQANPHLRGRAIGVCEHLGGIILAPSIEAKRLGIKTAMPVWEARKLCPDIILLPVDPPKYREITRRFLKIFYDYTDLVERYSIDEAFLDVTSLINRQSAAPWSAALLYALEIKFRIRKEIGEWLTCSAGIAPNKLVAKIASDLDKPDGVTVIKPGDIPLLYQRLCLTDIPGIGRRIERQLNRLGIFSVIDLAVFPETQLRAKFGMVGHYLHQLGNFRDSGGLVTAEDEQIKSVGHSYTMPKATADELKIKKLLFKLSEKVAVRLRRKSFWGSIITCYARFADQKGQTIFSNKSLPPLYAGKSRKIGDLVCDGKIIFRQAWKIFKSFPIRLPVRMAGVTVSGLVADIRPRPLFERYQKPYWAVLATDRVNHKYGDFTLRPALLMDSKDLAPDTVGFGRMKEMSR